MCRVWLFFLRDLIQTVSCVPYPDSYWTPSQPEMSALLTLLEYKVRLFPAAFHPFPDPEIRLCARSLTHTLTAFTGGQLWWELQVHRVFFSRYVLVELVTIVCVCVCSVLSFDFAVIPTWAHSSTRSCLCPCTDRGLPTSAQCPPCSPLPSPARHAPLCLTCCAM